MNKKIKKLWIKALLSGDYEQGQNGLRRRDLEDGDKFCCLGVLCELYKQEIGGVTWRVMDTISSPTWFRILGDSSVLPNKIREWAGLDEANGQFSYKNGKMESLSALNDSGKTFKQIAKVIEKYF